MWNYYVSFKEGVPYLIWKELEFGNIKNVYWSKANPDTLLGENPYVEIAYHDVPFYIEQIDIANKPKKTRKRLSLEEKRTISERIDKGWVDKRLAEEYDVSVTTINKLRHTYLQGTLFN